MKYSTPTLEINLNAVKHNYNTIKKYCADSEVCGTVKASSLAMGAPWTAEDHNAKYDQLLDNSIKKYENSYISKLDMTMPEDIESYFSK